MSVRRVQRPKSVQRGLLSLTPFHYHREMRPFALLLLVACGEASGTDPLVPDDSTRPECAPCGDALRRETDPCGAQLDDCTNDRTNTLEENVACFDQDGRCYSDALL